MNKRNIVTVFLVCLTAFTAVSQTTRSEIKKNIAQIKKSSLYIYADVTALTAEEARMFAEEQLYNKIKEWAATKKRLQGAESFLINNKQINYEVLSTTRGNMYQVVVYVKKSDIQKAGNADIIENTKTGGAKQSSNSGMSITQAEGANGYQAVYPDIVKEIAVVKGYADLIKKVHSGKVNGRIVDYARYSRELMNTEAYYFAIYDKSGNIVALLTPGVSRRNVMTGESESIDNYKGCGAIIFKTKE